MILQSVITCPGCGTATSETMPTDACRFFYACPGCGVTLRAQAGGLLCFLLLRLRAVSAGSGGTVGRGAVVLCGLIRRRARKRTAKTL